MDRHEAGRLEDEGERGERGGERRRDERAEEAGRRDLRQRRRSDRQRDDEPGREARLGRRRAGVALQAVAGLERGGELAQQGRQVAAGVALEQDRGDERVPRPRARASPQALEHRFGRLAELERARRDPQLVPGGAGQRRRDVGERPAHRVAGRDRVRERAGGAGRSAPELLAVAGPPRPDHADDRRRAGQRRDEPEQRAAEQPPGGEQRARRQPAEPAPLHPTRRQALPPRPAERRDRGLQPLGDPARLGGREHLPRAEHPAGAGGCGERGRGRHPPSRTPPPASLAAIASPSGARQVGRPFRSE